MAKEMYRIDRGLYPGPVLSKFHRRSATLTKRTRAVTMGNFDLPKYRLQLSCRNFVFRGIKLWESLPMTLRMIDNMDTFVANTKLWLLDDDVDITKFFEYTVI